MVLFFFHPIKFFKIFGTADDGFDPQGRGLCGSIDKELFVIGKQSPGGGDDDLCGGFVEDILEIFNGIF